RTSTQESLAAMSNGFGLSQTTVDQCGKLAVHPARTVDHGRCQIIGVQHLARRVEKQDTFSQSVQGGKGGTLPLTQEAHLASQFDRSSDVRYDLHGEIGFVSPKWLIMMWRLPIKTEDTLDPALR